jgi:hypothetical protein
MRFGLTSGIVRVAAWLSIGFCVIPPREFLIVSERVLGFLQVEIIYKTNSLKGLSSGRLSSLFAS